MGNVKWFQAFVVAAICYSPLIAIGLMGYSFPRYPIPGYSQVGTVRDHYACRYGDDWVDGPPSANRKACKRTGGIWDRQTNFPHRNPYGNSQRIPIPQPNPFRI